MSVKGYRTPSWYRGKGIAGRKQSRLAKAKASTPAKPAGKRGE